MSNQWEIKKLGDVAYLSGRIGWKGLTAKEYIKEGPLFLSVYGLNYGDYVDYRDAFHISQERYDESPEIMLRDGDILLCKDGSGIGKLGIIDKLPEPATINSSLLLIRANRDVVPKYLYWALCSPLFQKVVQERIDGATTPHLYQREIRQLEIPLPPLPEQNRIVAILDEAFDGLATAKAKTEKNLQNTRALFESYLQGVDADKVPLGSLVNITTGKLDANAAVDDGKYPFFTCSREIYAIDKYAFDCEAILLAGNNAVGDFNVKHYSGKFNAYQRTYVITVNAQKRVNYRFLYFQLLKSLKKFKAQSVGAGTKFLKLGMIKDLETALPTLVQQERTVAALDSLQEETEGLETIYRQKLVALNALKQSMLHQGFSGNL